MLARASPFGETDANGSIIFGAIDISNAVSDLPLSVTRTGLYIYLNAALCARPILDDSAMINHLHARYPSDTQTMIVDLIIASFDALANALHRRESSHTLLGYRSFIANKLPLVLIQLSVSLYPSITIEHCIQMALARIEVHPFPPLSADSNGINDALGESRQDFIQSCHLHQLVSDNLVTQTHGQHSSPRTHRSARYAKEALIPQCTSNVHRVEELIADLDKMDGNVGAIALAVTESIQHFCNVKETMSLKAVCNAACRHLPSIDVVLQYVQIEHLLGLLCNVLNDWTSEDDLSELQPAYEEFAAILLFVLALIHRYDLDLDDLSSIGHDSFVVRMLRQLSDSTSTNHLTEDQSQQLDKWVNGLYATDDRGETSGISDETMSGCPPQAFYMLVPTLFEQSVQACKAGLLDQKTLQGGLECECDRAVSNEHPADGF